MLVYGRDTVLQVVHNRGHGFQKVLTRPGCTNSNTHSINLGKTKSKPNEAFTTKQSQDSEIFQGATPLSRPATEIADSETDSRFATMAVNDWEPENSSLSIQRKRVTIPKQYSVLSIAQFN
jgi:hypothetical protein